jgi:hypothetical protein
MAAQAPTAHRQESAAKSSIFAVSSELGWAYGSRKTHVAVTNEIALQTRREELRKNLSSSL